MKITLQAFASSGGSYRVEFSDETGVLRVFCHCQAGVLQQMCKHKVALLKGDCKMLYDAAETSLLNQVLTSPAYPAMKLRLAEYETRLGEIEREVAKVKEKEKAVKKEFAHELTHGKPSSNPSTKKDYIVHPPNFL